MNRYRFFTAINWVVALLLTFSACTNDEPMNPNALPEGKYPLVIASVTMSVESSSEPWGADAPQTRVSESDDRGSSVWQDGDRIRVGIESYADSESRIYDIQVLDNKEITVSPSTDGPVYWKSTTPNKVRAWFPADGKVDLSNQTKENGLVYALYAETINTVDYNTQDIALPFEHKLAKVRVLLEGDQADQANEIKIKTYTSCTIHADGTVTAGDAEDYISMVQTTYNSDVKCWEANVVPGHPITDFQVNGVKGTLNNGITPEKGKLHEINITVEGQLQHIDLSTITESTLTVSGEAVITGKNDNLQITIEPDAQVTLKDIDLTYNEGPTIICQGDAHITLSGKNRLSATSKSQYDPSTIHDLGSGIEMRSAGTLTIESEAESSLEITRKTVDSGGLAIPYGAGIGLCSNANLIIKGGQFVVTGGSPSRSGGANIGGIYNENSVGTITIEGGTFTLQDKCMVSTLVGAGSYGTCGTVTIRAGVTINGTTYTEDHIGEIE